MATREQSLIAELAAKVAQFGFEVPAIFLLETMRPLNFVMSQALVFFAPLLGALLPAERLESATRLLERRDGVEALIRAIEEKLSER